MKKSRVVSVLIVVMVMLVATLAACSVDASYKINFEVDGTQFTSISTSGKEAISLPTNPTKEGFAFDGWYFDKDVWEQPLTINSFLDKKLTSDTTVYAKWLPNEAQIAIYTVTFNANGGSVVDAQKITDGSFANQPTAPTKAGFSFAGWFKEANFATLFDFTTDKIIADTTVYAKWLPNEAQIAIYTVTFNANGGSVVDAQKIVEGYFASIPTAPTKAGFSFAGWYKEASFATLFDFTTDKITADTTIYAKWLEIFDVTFNANGGSVVAAQKITDGSFANQPTAPTKVGFIFDGWYKEASLAMRFNFADKITADTTIYAKWLDIFDLTFEANGGSVVDTQKVADGRFANQPTEPTKVGFIFDGWYKEASLAMRFDFADKITANTTIYAKWLEIFDVKFNSNGGSAVDTQKVVEGSFAIVPTNPIKANCTFAGWCKDERLTTPFNFTTDKITIDTMVYAKWKIDSYTVTFETNGGSTIPSQTTEYNSLASIPIAPTKTGFSFAGWFKDTSFATAFDFASDKITANATIYAKWLEIFDVTFETSGGSAVDTQKVADGSLASQPTAPTKTGFSFAGWYKEANFATPFNFASDIITANTTVYAKWLEIFDVTFNANGGSVVAAQKITDGSLANRPTEPTKSGFTFDGWYKEANFATPFNFTTDIITANTTVYAKWKINSYTVSFETSGGSTIPSQTIEYNSFSNQPTAPTKTGFTFDGWYKEAGFATPFNFTTDKITADTIIYAKWKINSYTVSFEANGGSTISSQTIEYNSLANRPTAPTKTDCAFAGWYKEAGLATPFNFASDTITADTTIYAKWLEIFDVIFETSGGSVVAAQKITDGSLANQPTAPTKTGFTFAGWYKEAGLATPFNFASDTITADTTIYAKWLEIFDVIFETSGGSVVAAQKITDGSLANQPTAPTKTGFTFAGWYKEANFATPFDFTADKITANTTTYAKWLDIFDLIFEANGGSAVAAQKVEDGNFATLPTSPTKANDFFEGWFKEASLTTPFNFASDKITADTIIYAKWNGCAIDSFLTFTFADRLNSAYSVAKRPGATFPEIIALPAEYNGKPVVAIGNSAFPDCTALTSITIPEGVTSIGERAFENCSSLTSITIPASVTIIGGSAFWGCSSLTSITFEAVSKLTTIGYSAFRFCSGLTSVTIPASVTSISNFAFHNCSGLTSVTFEAGSKLTTIGERAFDSCSSLTSVSIPASVTRIGNGAFNNCSGLTSITIPASVTSISNFAFHNCSGLTSVTFEAGSKLTTIGERAFDSCSSLTSITIPAGVTTIGTGPFSSCNKLTNIIVDSGNTNYKSIEGNLYSKDGAIFIQYAFGKTATSFEILASVTTISAYAFYGYSSLTSVTFEAESKLTSIGNDAFRGCNSLTNFTIPASVTTIGGHAFSDCRSLTSITIPASVTTIGGYAFSDCYSLTSITIPASVTSIGYSAFFDCRLTIIYAEAASQPAGWDVGWNIIKGMNCYPVGWGCNNIKTNADYDYVVHNNEVYLTKYKWSVVDVVIPATIDGKAVVSLGATFSGSTRVKVVYIPSSVTTIGGSAFRGCSSLTSVTIPAGVTTIGDWAFSGCSSLTSVTIPASVTSIGDRAFYGCNSLTSVIIPASVTTIGNDAFRGCYSLTIYAEAASKPAGWVSDQNYNWNPDNRKVVWGHKI